MLNFLCCTTILYYCCTAQPATRHCSTGPSLFVRTLGVEKKLGWLPATSYPRCFSCNFLLQKLKSLSRLCIRYDMEYWSIDSSGWFEYFWGGGGESLHIAETPRWTALSETILLLLFNTSTCFEVLLYCTQGNFFVCCCQLLYYCWYKTKKYISLCFYICVFFVGRSLGACGRCPI